MINRHLEPYLVESLQYYPILTLTGPRQSGKTTLLKKAFPNHEYVLFEDPDLLAYANEDPRGLIEQYSNGAIFDEVQNVPHLFSYLQGEVDEKNENGQFILSGSQQFLLNEKISQSLAGRTSLMSLLPFSLAELSQRSQQSYWLTDELITNISPPEKNCLHYIFSGMYPRLHANNIPPTKYYRDYVHTYVNRDLRQLLEVSNLGKFNTFLSLAAGRTGQILNYSALASDAGIDQTTAKRWLSILESSYIIYLLKPHHRNFNKRLTKSPKIYFIDPGLACFLLKINDETQLQNHPLLGNLFETFIFSELYKTYLNADQMAPLYFWRDLSQKEVDFMIERSQTLFPIEVKSGQTLTSDQFKTLHYWLDLKNNPQTQGCLIYRGNKWQTRNDIQIMPWFAVS